MKIVQIFQPQRGTVRKIALREKITLSLNFDIASVETMQEGKDLLFVFSDGSIVLLENFYSTNTPPMFLLANGEIVQSFEDMMASADAKLPQIDTSTEGLSSSNADVLSMPVAGGNPEFSNGGLGEYREPSGNIIGGIDRLGMGGSDVSSGDGLGSGFLSDGIGATSLPSSSATSFPPSKAPGMPSWSDITNNPALSGPDLDGLKVPVDVYPGISIGGNPTDSYSGIIIELGMGWNYGQGHTGEMPDTLIIGGVAIEVPTSPSDNGSITVGGNTYSFVYIKGTATNPPTITITGIGGATLSQAEIDAILSSMQFQNGNVGNNVGLDTGFREIEITLTDKNGTVGNNVNLKDDITPSIDTDLNFRDIIDLAGTPALGGNRYDPLAGGLVTGTVGTVGGTGSNVTVLGDDNDKFVNGITGSDDTIRVNSSATGDKNILINGGMTSSNHITGSLNDKNIIVGNGVWNGQSNVVDTVSGNLTDYGNNTLIGGNKNDTIYGGKKNDFINAGLGDNLIHTGGGEIDTATGTTGTTIVLNTGKDTIIMNGVGADDYLHLAGDLGNSTVQSTVGSKNDNITLSGSMNGGLIDVADGNDSIKIGLNMAGGSINLGIGNNSVGISGVMNGGTINGDSVDATSNNSINIGFGNIDSITGNLLNNTLAVMDNTAVINGGAGRDSIHLHGNMNGGTVNGGDGRDSITIDGTLTGGVIHGGTGADTIHIRGDVNNGTVDGGLGNDNITVGGNITGGILQTGNGNDSVNIMGGMTGGTITAVGTIGNNSINIGSGNFDPASGIGGLLNDTLVVLDKTAVIETGSGDDDIRIYGVMAGGTINTGDGNDQIWINGIMQGGVINSGNGGAVTQSIDYMFNGNVHTALGIDGNVINIGNHAEDINGSNPVTPNPDVFLGGIINGGDANDLIQIHGNIGKEGSVCGAGTGTGVINAGKGNDYVIVHGNMNAGTIDGGAGNDIIAIDGNMNGGKIDATEGKDTIKIEGQWNCGEIEFGKDGGQLDIGKDGSDFTHNNTMTVDNNVIAMTNGTLNIAKGENVSVNLHGDVVAGTIALGSLNQLHIHGSVGDKNIANAMSATISTTGNSSITVAGRLDAGASVQLNGTTISGGDNIDIGYYNSGITAVYPEFAPGKMFADVMTGGIVDASGSTANNTITLHGNMTGGSVLGGKGNDAITIKDSMKGGEINGGSGSNSIFIQNDMMNGLINGGLDNDSITIDRNMTGGTVNGGAGNDTVLVNTTMTGGTINGGLGNDSININAMSNGVVNSDEGNDTININAMSNGGISGGVGEDSISVNTMSNGVINSGSGNDTINIGTMTNGTVSGGVGNDSINITTMNGGIIRGDELGATVHGNNNINITTMNFGVVNAGHGDSNINIGTLESGTIYTDNGDNKVNVVQMNDGTINCGINSDNVTIGIMTNGTVNLVGGSNFLDITEMQGGTINGGSGTDIVTIGIMTGGTLNFNGGFDEIRVNALEKATVNLTSGGAKFEATITGDGVTILTNGLTTESNTITLKLDTAYKSFKDVLIEGGAADDTLVIKVNASEEIALKDFPGITGVELIKIAEGCINLGDISSHEIDSKFGNNAELTIQIIDASQINLGGNSSWSLQADGTYKYVNGSTTLTVKFVDDKGTILSKPVTKTVFEEAQENTILSVAKEVEEEEGKKENQLQVAQIAAVALAVSSEELLKEESLLDIKGEDKKEDTTMPSDTIVSTQPVKPSVEEKGEVVNKEEENVQIQPPIDNDVFVDTELEVKEDIIELTSEYVVEEPPVVLEVAENVKATEESYILSEEIEAPIALQVVEEISFEEEVLEDMQIELGEINGEEVLTKDEYPLLPEGDEMMLEVTFKDLLAEYSTEIPREEVEVEMGIYTSTEMDSWYASEVSVSLNVAESPYTINETEGIQFAQNSERHEFTLEEPQIISFEFVPPSMEIQYDEQAF